MEGKKKLQISQITQIFAADAANCLWDCRGLSGYDKPTDRAFAATIVVMIELPLSDEQVAMYRATAKRRRELDRPAEQERRKVGWAAARQAAELLRTQYNVTRVVVFGSLVHDGRFTRSA